MQESEFIIAQKEKSTKLPKYPFKKGDVIGNFTVNNDDYVYHHKRYQVELICECGGLRYRRPSQLDNSKYIWCAKCRGYNNPCLNRRTRNPNFINGIHISWLTSVNSNDSLKRGGKIIESSITNEDLLNQYNKQNGICVYTGIELDIINTLKHESNASIDRRDSNLGYIVENIQWVYKPLNLMKNSFSEEEFIFVCKKVANNIR